MAVRVMSRTPGLQRCARISLCEQEMPQCEQQRTMYMCVCSRAELRDSTGVQGHLKRFHSLQTAFRLKKSTCSSYPINTFTHTLLNIRSRQVPLMYGASPILSPLVPVQTFHTTSCISLVRSQPLLSSRRGQLASLEDARIYVSSLSMSQRSSLEKALQETTIDANAMEDVTDDKVEVPSRNQLKLLCYQTALPFIGFGFLDNVIMITVGEYIDWTVGVTFGISTMAAAGIGNMISDLAGLGLADQVEAFCLRFGIPNPKLSSAQLRHRSARWTTLLGRCVGIIIGCTIGMAPLYWIDDRRKTNDECTHEHSN